MGKKSGFTLVEILVVIAILAILSMIVLVIYNGVTAKARDTQRIKDLQSIKQALILYRSDVHYYPATSIGLSALAPYLSSIPTDLDSANRIYQYLATPNSPVCDNSSLANACNGFVLCAKKEGSGTTDTPSECLRLSCGSVGNCDMGISSD